MENFRQLSQNEVKERQMEILDFIDRKCSENGLDYFLAYGTLLGAVRHGGYIPWDDDIDIFVPRKDYEKLREVINSEDKYFFDDIVSDDKYRLEYGKVVDKHTKIEEYNAVVPSAGIFVDVFPLDFIGDSYEEARKNLDAVNGLQKKFHLYNWSLDGILEFNPVKKIMKKAYLAVKKIQMKTYDVRKTMFNHREKMMTYSNTYSKIIGRCDSPFKKNYMLFNSEWFQPSRMNFENRTYSVPKDYDAVLTSMFGDYMVLPPEEERVSHNIIAYEMIDDVRKQ